MGREDNDTMEGYSFEASDSVVGYLAADGSVLLAPQYNYANSFSSGAAAVSYDTVHWAYINEAGEYITDFDYLAVDSFVWYENYVIGRADESAAYFVDGYCVVTKDGAHFGVIDLNGEEVIACEYEGALALHDGRIVLQQDGVWGVVNLNA